jgi:hypothetical protein
MSGKKGFILALFGALILAAGCEDKSATPTAPMEYWDISGKAVNIYDGSPVVRAKVYFWQDSVLTNSSGEYEFEDVPEGKYAIVVLAENHVQYIDSVLLIHDMTYNVPLRLESITIPSDTSSIPTDTSATLESNCDTLYILEDAVVISSDYDAIPTGNINYGQAALGAGYNLWYEHGDPISGPGRTHHNIFPHTSNCRHCQIA